jgi:predicted metal-dependent phosphoesterase TrpH
MYEALHNHTDASDGTQNYLEVLDTAHQFGFGTVAFTDHDAVPSAKDLLALKAYAGPTKWVTGIEVSSGLPRELGGGPVSSLHILGQFIDPTQEVILEHCRLAQSARIERMERIVTNLKSLGFSISIDDCLSASDGESVGRPHIVTALFSHPENQAVIDRITGEMAAAAVNDASVAMDYMRLLGRHETDRPYRLFLSEDAFIKDIYVDYLYNIDFDRAVELIRQAGGVAIFAHWFTVKKKIDAALLKKLVSEKRIDGLEIISNPSNEDGRREIPFLLELTEAAQCLSTYGLDSHRPDHFKRYNSYQSLGATTVGQTKRLIERVKPNLAFSNL